MKKISLVLLSFILFLIGCAEKPKNVGNGLIGPSDLVTVDTISFIATSTFAYKKTLTNGFSSSNLVGRISNEQEAISFFKFTQYALVDSLKGATIDTAELRLNVNYRWNPSLPIQFEVREFVDYSWSQVSFNGDSLLSSYIGTASLGVTSPSDSMNINQQVTAVISDTASIRKWANAYFDTVNPKFNGFVLQAKNNTPTGVIGFSTFSSSIPPVLIIKYTRNGHHDSISFIYGEDTYIAKTPQLPGFGVHGGFGIRSKVFFDISKLDSLPKSEKPFVLEATLEMTLRSDSSNIYGYSPDSVVAILGGSSIVPDSTIGSVVSFGFRIADTTQTVNPTYRFDVMKIAQQLVNNIYDNEGIQLRWVAEGSTVEKAVFFGANDPDVSKRPKLKITYGRKSL